MIQGLTLVPAVQLAVSRVERIKIDAQAATKRAHCLSCTKINASENALPGILMYWVSAKSVRSLVHLVTLKQRCAKAVTKVQSFSFCSELSVLNNVQLVRS